MRLLEHMMRTVTVKPAAAPAIYQENDRLYRFDGSRAFAIRAALQPLAEHADAAVCGETPGARLLMLYDGEDTLDEGMGVCVDASNDAPCDYRIAEMPRRYQSHKECTLAFIPEDMRG
jgi:hypothetical protein